MSTPAIKAKLYARRRYHSFAALRPGRGAGREAHRPARATGTASARAAGAAGRESPGTRKVAALPAPALAALDVVCAAAAGAGRQRLLVRHRRPRDVNRQRL